MIYRIKILIFLSAMSFAAYAQERETRSLAPFSRVEFEGRGELHLHYGDESAAEIEVSEEGTLQQVKTSVSGNTLHISYDKEGKTFPIEPKVYVFLTSQQLEAVRVAGMIAIQTEEPITGRRFSLQVEGVGKNYLDVAVEKLLVSCAGAANIYLSGQVNDQEIVLDGTGTIDAFKLMSKRTVAEVNGTGSLLVNTTESLTADANGFGAEIRYRGQPKKKTINKSGFVRVKEDRGH